MKVEILNIIVEILRISVWPAVLLVIYFFSKSDFSSLIRRVNKANFFGNEIAISQEQPKVMSENDGFQPVIGASNRNFYDSFGIIKELEKDALKICSDLPESERFARIVNIAAFENFIRNLQWVYIYIYGSQIEFLELLASKFPIGGIPISETMSFFNELKRLNRFFDANVEFDGWVGFMLTFKLIRQEDGKYFLDSYGRALLVYIIENKMIKNKGL
ncbi:hypothetical protein FCH33_01965 [Serratia fonticola]|uniref:hypothetical protein n=1 Tax=Serratia fonticola TaxID=47917 RepID=UPI001576C857|nr:hypothetical protein [Serratia fonticola]NTY85542.1 hypothetical protein [Serratia fonticola]NTZ11615.1 hypothetical protein [Serratia fonticola]